MRHFLSRRLEGMAQSDIRAMTRECERIGGINLGQSLCALPTPSIVREAAIEAITRNNNSYSLAEGISELRGAISAKLQRDNGISADPNTEIVVTVGATGAFASTVNALLNPGDGILLFEPFYGYHQHISLVAGLEPQYIALQPPAFGFTKEVLIAAIRPNTRALVICTPSNPSGKMFTQSELEIIAEVAEEYDFLVITDEIYEYIRYENRSHISPATVGGLRDRTVTIMGFSKTFAVAGWRLGYAVAPQEMALAIRLVTDAYYCCPSTPLQHGVIAGLYAPPEYFQQLRSDYQKKRDMLFNALLEADLAPLLPQGAFYVFTDISNLGCQTAREAAMKLLTKAGVASVPGSAFYKNKIGEQLVRFCYAVEFDVLQEACERLRCFRN